MAGMDINKILNAYRDQFNKDIRSPLMPEVALKALCNTEYEGDLSNGGRTVKVFTVPEMTIRKQKLDDRDNLAAIPRQDAQLVAEEMKVNETADFNFAYTPIVNQLAELPNVTEKIARQLNVTLQQNDEIDIASNFVYTPVENIISGAKDTVNGAVTEGDTTITLDDATNFSAGDIIFFTDTSGDTGAALIKSKATNTLTIETDSSLFPQGGALANKDHFAKLVTALPAIADGAVVAGDKPIAVTKSTIYDKMVELHEAPANFDVPSGDFCAFSVGQPINLLKKEDSTVLKNDFLGKEVILNGQVLQLDGMNIIKNNNGIQRLANGKMRFYVWVFKKNYSIHRIDFLDALNIDKIAETAPAAISHAGVKIYQSGTFRQGRKGMALLCCEI